MSLQHQLSVITQESESKTREAEQHEATIAKKEADIQELHQKLQEQQALQCQQSSHLQAEKEKAVAAALEELQARLMEAEQTKGKAEGELAAAQLLREREEELRQLELAAQKKVRTYSICLWDGLQLWSCLTVEVEDVLHGG